MRESPPWLVLETVSARPRGCAMDRVDSARRPHSPGLTRRRAARFFGCDESQRRIDGGPRRGANGTVRG